MQIKKVTITQAWRWGAFTRIIWATFTATARRPLASIMKPSASPVLSRTSPLFVLPHLLMIFLVPFPCHCNNNTENIEKNTENRTLSNYCNCFNLKKKINKSTLKGQFNPNLKIHILPITCSAIYPRSFWCDLEFWSYRCRDVCLLSNIIEVDAKTRSRDGDPVSQDNQKILLWAFSCRNNFLSTPLSPHRSKYASTLWWSRSCQGRM